jgi:threonine dehydratase
MRQPANGTQGPDASSQGELERPTLEGIRAARDSLRPFLAETPLVRSELLSRALGAEVWLKVETVSPVASFKARGALTAMLRTRDRGPLSGVVTSSTGNHGQGVAFAARTLGVPAYVFMPERPNALKRRMVEAFGASVRLLGHDIDAAKEAALAFAAERDLAFIDDGESPDVMEGAGTVGLEIAERLDRVDAVFVPMGSGTLAGGCAAAVKGLHRDARVVAVQSKGAPAMVESFHAGWPVERPIDTVADGLVSRVPAEFALQVMLKLVDDAFAVPDEDLLAALRTLAEAAHVLVEPSGSAGLAGAWSHRGDLGEAHVALVLTGANVTLELLARALAGPALIRLERVS